tara:strand:- start:6848 stop:7696 length:849 start_codon:yes stop_codon:yes gene_type:complete
MNNKDEKLLREFVRKTFITNILREQKEEHLQEQKVRRLVRHLIKEVENEQVLENLFEAKDMANPHPNTGINKLRDAIRKAKPSIKSKFQQLTTDASQRESFTNHFLGAMVRLFDELDALNAQGKDLDTAVSDFDSSPELETPPPDITSDEMIDDIEADGDLDDLLEQIDIDLDDEVDLVSDDEEQKREKSQVEKDFDKKSDLETKRQEFGAGIDGDSTGRNQAFDAFNLVQTYFSDSYLDLNNLEDQEMFKKWCLYNVKLLLDKYEQELSSNPAAPNIENPT